MNIKFLPNIATLVNIFCGFLSILFAINGQSVFAAWLIIIAVGFDIIDGYAARIYSVVSDFGKELDSLSDLVSFGVAVSILLYVKSNFPFGIALVSLSIYLFCGTFRLARFNVSSSSLRNNFFEGLPITAAGGTIASAFLVFEKANPAFSPYILFSLAIILAFFMVSKIKYPVFKKQKIHKLKSLISFTVILILLILAPALTICLCFLIYVILSPLKFKLKEGK